MGKQIISAIDSINKHYESEINASPGLGTSPPPTPSTPISTRISDLFKKTEEGYSASTPLSPVIISDYPIRKKIASTDAEEKQRQEDKKKTPLAPEKNEEEFVEGKRQEAHKP
jgi:hypothetical protein